MKGQFKRLFHQVTVLACITATTSAQQWMEATGRSSTKDTMAGWRRHFVEGFTQKASYFPGDTIQFRISTMGAINIQNPRTAGYVNGYMRIFRVTDAWSEAGDEAVTGTFPIDSLTFHPLRGLNTDSLLYPVDMYYHQTNKIYSYDYRRGCMHWKIDTSFILPQWASGIYLYWFSEKWNFEYRP